MYLYLIVQIQLVDIDISISATIDWHILSALSSVEC